MNSGSCESLWGKSKKGEGRATYRWSVSGVLVKAIRVLCTALPWNKVWPFKKMYIWEILINRGWHRSLGWIKTNEWPSLVSVGNTELAWWLSQSNKLGLYLITVYVWFPGSCRGKGIWRHWHATNWNRWDFRWDTVDIYLKLLAVKMKCWAGVGEEQR